MKAVITLAKSITIDINHLLSLATIERLKKNGEDHLKETFKEAIIDYLYDEPEKLLNNLNIEIND